MLLALYSFLELFIFFRTNFAQYFVRPSFEPYCITGDMLCRVICKCRVIDFCTLLPMDNEIRETILLYLNQARNLQTMKDPEPSGLSVLQYNMNLEELSICWAVSCEDAFIDCFRTPSFPNSSQAVGQISIKGKFPTVKLWYDLISRWSKEIDSSNTSYIQKIPSGDDGFKVHNFAQILSDKVLFVGCAWSVSKDIMTFICTFAPSGPIQGQRIYQTGRSCSTCFEGYSCNRKEPFPNLCKFNPIQVINKCEKKIQEIKKSRLTNPGTTQDYSDKGGKPIKIPLLLTVIVLSIVVCIFLSILFLTGYYVMYW